MAHEHTLMPLQIDLSNARSTVKEDKTLILDYIVKGSAKLEEGQDQQLQFLSNTLKLFFILHPLDFKMDVQQANLLEEGGWGSAKQQQQEQQYSSSDTLFDLSAYSAWLSLDPGHDNYRCLAVYGGAGSGEEGHGRGGWAHGLPHRTHTHVHTHSYCTHPHAHTHFAHTDTHACMLHTHTNARACILHTCTDTHT